MGPIWATHMGPIWGVQPGSAWVPYGLAHMQVARMGPIWVTYTSPIKLGPSIKGLVTDGNTKLCC